MCFFVGLQSFQKSNIVISHYFLFTVRKIRFYTQGFIIYFWFIHARYVRTRPEPGKHKCRTVLYKTQNLLIFVRRGDYFWLLGNRSRLSKASFQLLKRTKLINPTLITCCNWHSFFCPGIRSTWLLENQVNPFLGPCTSNENLIFKIKRLIWF